MLLARARLTTDVLFPPGLQTAMVCLLISGQADGLLRKNKNKTPPKDKNIKTVQKW